MFGIFLYSPIHIHPQCCHKYTIEKKNELKLNYDFPSMLHSPHSQSKDFLSAEGSYFSSEGRDLDPILQALFAFFQRQVTITQSDFHFVPLSEHLADLQESLVLRLWDHQPDVNQRDQADEGKDDKTVGAQASLEEEGQEMWSVCSPDETS